MWVKSRHSLRPPQSLNELLGIFKFKSTVAEISIGWWQKYGPFPAIARVKLSTTAKKLVSDVIRCGE